MTINFCAVLMARQQTVAINFRSLFPTLKIQRFRAHSLSSLRHQELLNSYISDKKPVASHRDSLPNDRFASMMLPSKFKAPCSFLAQTNEPLTKMNRSMMSLAKDFSIKSPISTARIPLTILQRLPGQKLPERRLKSPYRLSWCALLSQIVKESLKSRSQGNSSLNLVAIKYTMVVIKTRPHSNTCSNSKDKSKRKKRRNLRTKSGVNRLPK